MEQPDTADCQISPADESRIWRWNAGVPAPTHRCIHQIFQETARRFPSSTAVCAWDKTLRYDALDQLSSRLAILLVKLGVGSETPVILCFDKSAWAVVAALGVLKAGGAFVPVGAGNADSRATNIIEQTKAHIVLTQASYLVSYTNLVHKTIAVDDQLFQTIEMPDQEPPRDQQMASSVRQAAYIIFTSGSTGEPKGVVVEHEAAATSILSQGQSFGSGPETRQLQFSSYVFDMSISETFVTLLHGGCVCVPSETQRLGDLAGAIAAMKVTAAMLTPTMARCLDPSKVPTLQSLTLGAEMINESDLAQWKHLPRLMTGYGPTECAAVTHTHDITFHAGSQTASRTIGTAKGCVGWVVDPEDAQRLMPIGQVGELAIEGHTLARGYLDDQAKTNAAFIQDPAWLLRGIPSHPGRHGRVYKTGDLVYYNPDGTCEIVGRKDRQVKIRGQRVELGDIESSLRRVFPQVDGIAAELITCAGSQGPPQLAAFLLEMSMVKRNATCPSVRPLELTGQQRELLNSIRDVLRPTFFLVVHPMPTTPSGKLDRARLRELASSRSAQELLSLSQNRNKQFHLTENEELVAELWSQCLSIDPAVIQGDSNFFSLGGSSISALQLTAKAKKHGLNWNIKFVFANPELAQQAAVVAGVKPEVALLHHQLPNIAPFALLPTRLKPSSLLRTFQSTYGLKKRDIEDVLPCTPAQEHLMSVTAYRTHAFTLQLGMRIHHSIDTDQVKFAVEQVVSALPLLRTRMVRVPMGPALQVVMKDATVQWQHGSAIAEYLSRDATTDMDYGDALARFGVINDLNERWLVLTLHHALWDRWSLPLLLNMLRHAYKQEKVPQAPMFSHYIKEAAAMDNPASRAFWDAYLAHRTWNNFPRLPSGTTVPRASEMMRRDFAQPTISVPGVTLSVILRSAWAVLHSKGSGSNDVLFGTTVFGRGIGMPNVESVVGPTIATVPVRIHVPEQGTGKEYLDMVQKGVLDSAEHEHAWLLKFSEQSARKQSDIELNTVFVVQPRDHQRLDNPFYEDDQALWLLGAFDDHALLVQCEIFADSVAVTANFDPRAVRFCDVEKALDAFEIVCNELASGTHMDHVHDLVCNTKQLAPWQPPKPDSKKSWWRWFLCCLVIYGTSFLYGLDFTIAACMQDSIVATFSSSTSLTWIGSGFPLGSLILILPVGYIFGLFENRILYAGATTVFMVGSLLCGAAPNMDAIIAGRIIAGAGGGGMYLGALNSIGSLTKRRERTVYAAFTGFFYGIGVILGPIIGGAIAFSSITWRWGFYIIAIVAGLLVVLTAVLPAMEPRPGVSAPSMLRRMDWLGAALFATITIAWSVLFSGGGSTWSWVDARTWILVGILVVGLVAFVAQQHRNILTSETWKIFPTEFLQSRALVALFVVTAASGSALYITAYYTPLLFQVSRGEDAVASSIRIIPMMALFIVAVVAQGTLMPRLGPHMPWYLVGGVLILVGGALMCTVSTDTSAAAIQGYTILVGAGGGLCMQAAYAITTAKVKGEKLSSAISFINVAQIGAGVLSLTMAGAIYQNLGTQNLRAWLPPSQQGSSRDIGDLLAGLSSAAGGEDDALTRHAVDEAITLTIRKIFILVAVAGAVVVLSSMAMPVERLFYTKKKGKGLRSARHKPRVSVV